MISFEDRAETAISQLEDEDDEETRDWLEAEWRRRWSDELDDDND